MIAEIYRALDRRRFAHATELELQDGVAEAFAGAGLDALREATIAPGERVDFLVGETGVECKISGALAAVTRQLHAYAQSDAVRALVLVTTRAQHRRLPTSMNGKPLHVIHVGRNDL